MIFECYFHYLQILSIPCIFSQTLNCICWILLRIFFPLHPPTVSLSKHVSVVLVIFAHQRRSVTILVQFLVNVSDFHASNMNICSHKKQIENLCFLFLTLFSLADYSWFLEVYFLFINIDPCKVYYNLFITIMQKVYLTSKRKYENLINKIKH